MMIMTMTMMSVKPLVKPYMKWNRISRPEAVLKRFTRCYYSTFTSMPPRRTLSMDGSLNATRTTATTSTVTGPTATDPTSTLTGPTATNGTRRDRVNHNVCLIGKPGSGKGTYGTLLSNALHNCPLIVMGDVIRNHIQRQTDIGKEMEECQRVGRLADDELVARALLSHLEEIEMQRELKGKGQQQEPSAIDYDHDHHPEPKFGFILDGFPRTSAQAQFIIGSNEEDTSTTTSSISMSWPKKFQISFAVSIDVPDEICLSKMLGRRRCKKCHTSFNISDVHHPTPDGIFVMPPQLPSPYPCDRCNMTDDSDWEIRSDDTEEIMSRRIKEFHDKSSPVSALFRERNRLVSFVPYNGVQDMNVLEQKVRDKAQSLYSAS